MLDDADTFVNQATLKKFRHVSIFSWQKLIATLDDRQLHAESAECLREFATDRAAAEHDHALRLFVQLVENGFVREIWNVVDAFDFRNHCATAGSDDEILGAKLLSIHFHFVRGYESRFAAEDLYAERLQSLL